MDIHPRKRRARSRCRRAPPQLLHLLLLDTPQGSPLDLPALDVDARTRPCIVSTVKRSTSNCGERGGAEGKGTPGLSRMRTHTPPDVYAPARSTRPQVMRSSGPWLSTCSVYRQRARSPRPVALHVPTPRVIAYHEECLDSHR
ncbi:hypothetical protein DFH09DRAFT_1372974 [Mycena vulgaris]|nr:hypothetical protein DFH09DRAFT_1372974 [Mycena vulgaris]